MSRDTRELGNRIKSFDSTLHLTRAMGLVASSKIRKATDGMLRAKEYMKTVNDTVDMLTASPECAKSVYLNRGNMEGGKTKLIVIAGDRGLCGGYNVNVFRTIREYPGADIVPIGKRAADRYSPDDTEDYDSSEIYPFAKAKALAEQLCLEFKEGKYDRIGIVCNRYISIIAQEVKVSWILPLKRKEETSGKRKAGIIWEPDESSMIEAIVPEYVAGMIITAVRESFACEVAARRMAMDNAKKNAEQMIDDLQLEYNRARQGAITQEITEIVAGSGE